MSLRHAVILLAALGFLLTAPARADEPARTKDGKCKPDSRVIVEIKGVRLSVPRTARFRLTLDDGITKMTLNRPGPEYNCDTAVIPNVRGLATENYTVGIMAGRHRSSDKRFLDGRNAILGASRLRGSKVEKLPNGIQKVTAPAVGVQFFQLPLDVAPTADNVPVGFLCDNSESEAQTKIIPRICGAFYVHPSGLPFMYSVVRADYPGDDFIAADKANRKFLDDLVEAGKAKKDIENKDK